MKKCFFILLMLLFVSGCTKVKDMDKIEIIDKSIANASVGGVNQYRSGYKYYLPRGMNIVNKQDFNEIARSEKYQYYIYIDIVSYFNKVVDKYKINPKAFISKTLNYDNKYGYLEINEGKNYYLIEIMYNYAKIEVIVEKSDVNIAISNAINILSSIKYNDQIIKNLMEDNILKFNEMEFNIFETKKNVESNELTATNEYGQYEDVVHDSDLIN